MAAVPRCHLSPNKEAPNWVVLAVILTGARRRSDCFELLEREQHHAQQHEAITEARDLGRAVGARDIMDGDFDNLEVLPRSAQDEVEIRKRIEIAEICAVCFYLFVVGAFDRLGSAKRISEALVDKKAEYPSEEPVGDEIERAHRVLLHRIDKTGPVDELALAGSECGIE